MWVDPIRGRKKSSFPPSQSTLIEEIFNPELLRQVFSTDPSPVLLEHLRLVREKDPVARLQYLDIKNYLPGDILTKVDRVTMAVSLEARVPLLDHHVVEFASSIPPEFHVKGRTTKYLLKKVAERLLPKDVVHRPKYGFAIPIGEWIRHQWFDMSHELILGKRARARGNFNSAFLQHVFLEHRLGRRDHGSTLWTLMILERWFREIIDH